MATAVASPERGPRRPFAYDLDDEYIDRDALEAAICAQNRLCQKLCSVVHKPKLVGFSGSSSAVVYACKKCSFLLCAKISQSSKPEMDGRIKIVREKSILEHESLCTSHPLAPCRKELLANAEFVSQANNLKTHRQINEVIQRMFRCSVLESLTSDLRKDFADMKKKSGLRRDSLGWTI
jgi:hypothetical protein